MAARKQSPEVDAWFDQLDHPQKQTMLAVRDGWDPARRMNPGKLIPVRVCMEARTKPLVGAGR